jgi:hypothetical protein
MKKILFFFLITINVFAQSKISPKDWKPLFNGKNLDGWEIKIRGYDFNDNFGKTFSVKDKKIVVNYDAYDNFNFRYGHLFYKNSYSYYRIALDYRFVGEQAKGGEDWAWRNSGIMIHGQPAKTMGKDQDFPISIEVQLLGGKNDQKPRTTCNLCTPGTNVTYENKFDTRHCINSTSKTYDGDQWVHAEVEVLGDSLIRHYINGELVMTYTKPVIGGGVVSGFDPAMKPDGQPLTSGTISLQSESHPVEFKGVQLLNLKGCMNKKAKNYKSYFVKADNSSCKF